MKSTGTKNMFPRVHRISFGWTRGLFLLFLLLFFRSNANNVTVQPLTFDGAHLKFNISWDNAWRLDSLNHDAVWVFAKYRINGNEWSHLDLSPVISDHLISSPGQLSLATTSDGKGVFLHIPAGSNLTGDVGSVEVDLATKGFSGTGSVDIRIFAIEMVYVPEGAFYLGDASGNDCFADGGTVMPFGITSEAAIAVGQGAGQLTSTGDFPPASDIPSAWPKGHKAFYCMKHEISQEQYKDFLNTLTFGQQSGRTGSSPDGPAGTHAFSTGFAARNGIRIFEPGVSGLSPAVYSCDIQPDQNFDSADDAQNRACNWLSWDDVIAYLDWSGLRPMTEFEFEKVCRGSNYPVAGEFAWGTPEIVDANTLVNDGTENESVSDSISGQQGLGSHGYDGPQGPIRCGFGADSSNSRLHAGATLYGALEMSGNLWEQCVTVSAEGLNFTGANGNGQLDESGNADVGGWPGAAGGGFRGGGWNSGIIPGFRDLAVSDRFYAGLAPAGRRNTAGGRGVRTAE